MVAILAAVFAYFPDPGTFVPLSTSVGGNLSQLLYPALVLAVGFAANVMRTTRSEYWRWPALTTSAPRDGKGLRRHGFAPRTSCATPASRSSP